MIPPYDEFVALQELLAERGGSGRLARSSAAEKDAPTISLEELKAESGSDASAFLLQPVTL